MFTICANSAPGISTFTPKKSALTNIEVMIEFKRRKYRVNPSKLEFWSRINGATRTCSFWILHQAIFIHFWKRLYSLLLKIVAILPSKENSNRPSPVSTSQRCRCANSGSKNEQPIYMRCLNLDYLKSPLGM